MSSEREMSAYNAGLNGGVGSFSTAEEQAAFAAGQQAARARGGSGAGGGGGSMAFLAIFLWPIAFVLGVCLYPLAGALALAVTAMVAGVMEDSHRSGLMTYVMLIAPSLLFFVLGMLLEAFLERFVLYRIFRHLARAAAVGFVVHVIAFQFHGAGHFDPNMPLMDRITLPHAIAVIVAVIFGFVLSVRNEPKQGGAHRFRQRFRLSRAR